MRTRDATLGLEVITTVFLVSICPTDDETRERIGNTEKIGIRNEFF